MASCSNSDYVIQVDLIVTQMCSSTKSKTQCKWHLYMHLNEVPCSSYFVFSMKALTIRILPLRLSHNDNKMNLAHYRKSFLHDSSQNHKVDKFLG